VRKAYSIGNRGDVARMTMTLCWDSCLSIFARTAPATPFLTFFWPSFCRRLVRTPQPLVSCPADTAPGVDAIHEAVPDRKLRLARACFLSVFSWCKFAHVRLKPTISSPPPTIALPLYVHQAIHTSRPRRMPALLVAWMLFTCKSPANSILCESSPGSHQLWMREISRNHQSRQ